MLNGTDYFDWSANYGGVSPIPNGSTAVSNSGNESAIVNLAGEDGMRLDESRRRYVAEAITAAYRWISLPFPGSNRPSALR